MDHYNPPGAARSTLKPFLWVGLACFTLGVLIAGYLGMKYQPDLFGFGASEQAEDGAVTTPAALASATATPTPTPSASSAAADAAVERVTEQQGGLEQRLAAAEQRLARLDLQAQAASGNAARAEGLLIAFAARRSLARTHHPDAGGDPGTMQRINAAAAQALRLLRSDASATAAESGAEAGPETEWVGTTRDVPSFTIEALPAEAFEALLVAAAELGEVEDDDPPYELRTLLADPIACWCQLDLVPDAGASTVSVSIARVVDSELPALIDVRNAWITALNGLDWSAL